MEGLQAKYPHSEEEFLEQTAKGPYELNRLFRDVALDLGDPIKLYCDNHQTIRLVVNENERITTKLRHVDVQNPSARQELRQSHQCVPEERDTQTKTRTGRMSKKTGQSYESSLFFLEGRQRAPRFFNEDN